MSFISGMSDSACKAMCSSLPSCAGYTFGYVHLGGSNAPTQHGIVSSIRYCYVHGSMTSAPSGWNYISRSVTTISGTSGSPGYSCYVKEGTSFLLRWSEYEPRQKDEKEKRDYLRRVSSIGNRKSICQHKTYIL